jgi:hypothetical protein
MIGAGSLRVFLKFPAGRIIAAVRPNIPASIRAARSATLDERGVLQALVGFNMN